MKILNPVIDGCVFTKEEFEGCSEEIMKSKVDTFFLTINSFDGFAETVKAIARIYDYVDKDPSLKVIRNFNEIEENSKKGYKSMILTFQEPYPIGYSLENLRVFYELGVRVVQLTYNKANHIGTGCTEIGTGGLTSFGKEMILEMNRLGILVDLSHCNNLTSEQAIEVSQKPVVFSHANAFEITENPRNKNNDLIKLLASKGGVIGITPWGPLCWNESERKQPTIEHYLDHVEHIIQLVGIDHVAFGSDIPLSESTSDAGALIQATQYPEVVGKYYDTVGMDGQYSSVIGFKGAKEIDNIIKGLQGRGYNESDINKFLGGNFLRVLKIVTKKNEDEEVYK